MFQGSEIDEEKVDLVVMGEVEDLVKTLQIPLDFRQSEGRAGGCN